MAKIVTERRRVWRDCRTHEYRYKNDPDAGFSFPVDEVLSEEGKANLEYCKSHPDELIDMGIENYGWWYTENATAECECGQIIPLWDEYLGACECEHCGRWHNLFGQELKNPSAWEGIEDEDYY